VVRLTPNRRASATSAGSWAPGGRWPPAISSARVAEIRSCFSGTPPGRRPS